MELGDLLSIILGEQTNPLVYLVRFGIELFSDWDPKPLDSLGSHHPISNMFFRWNSSVLFFEDYDLGLLRSQQEMKKYLELF